MTEISDLLVSPATRAPIDRCDTCGQFRRADQPGASWGQYWSHDTSGTPDLHDPRFRCATCTDQIGEVGTNCHGEHYAGRNPVPTAGGDSVLASPADPHADKAVERLTLDLEGTTTDPDISHFNADLRTILSALASVTREREDNDANYAAELRRLNDRATLAEAQRDEAVGALTTISGTGQSIEPDHWKFRCMARDLAASTLSRIKSGGGV